MMEVQSIGIRRRGGENDPNASVVVSVQDIHGEWRDIGEERLDGAFSHNWSFPASWRNGIRLVNLPSD